MWHQCKICGMRYQTNKPEDYCSMMCRKSARKKHMKKKNAAS